MDAKSKAKDLIIKFTFARSEGHERYVARQCALILCDEVLYVIGEPTYFHETRAFWLKVKEEINKL